MANIFGVPMSAGTINQPEQATTEVVAEPVREAHACIEGQAVAHVDETSWHQGDQRVWLWLAVINPVMGFLIRLSRGGHVARELLGEDCSGILVTDRDSAYNWHPVRWRQSCWWHVPRAFETLRARGEPSEEIDVGLLT